MRETINNQYDNFGYLVRSDKPVRLAVLVELREEEKLAQRELIHRLTNSDDKNQNGQWDWSVADDTVKRAIGLDGKGLLQRGLIEETSESESAENQYQITWLGERSLQKIWKSIRFFELHHNENLRPFTSKAVSSEIDVTEDILFDILDAEVYEATEQLDHLWEKNIEFSEPSDTIIGMSKYVKKYFVELYERYLTEEERDVQLITTPGIRNDLREDYPQSWSKCAASGNLDFYVYDGEIKFNWTILEHGVAWGIFEEGAYKLELLSESDQLREWALQIFHLHKERSKDITEEEAEWAENHPNS